MPPWLSHALQTKKSTVRADFSSGSQLHSSQVQTHVVDTLHPDNGGVSGEDYWLTRSTPQLPGPFHPCACTAFAAYQRLSAQRLEVY